MTQPASRAGGAGTDRSGSPAPDPDPLTTVSGLNGTPYPCPDIAAVDRHIGELSHRIRQVSHIFPELVAGYRAEIDLLLDRRAWLGSNEAPAPGTTPA